MTWSPRLTRAMHDSELQSLALGLPVVDEYLQFVGARCSAEYLARHGL